MKTKRQQKADNKRRQAAFRERQKENGLVPLTVMIKEDYKDKIRSIVKELNEL